MQRFLLIHEGQRILLPLGETLIGRGLTCTVRFNDPAVSREHLKVVVIDGRIAAVNLSANGTLLNGEKMTEPRQLRDGDVLRFGYRRVAIEIVPEASDQAGAGQANSTGSEQRRPTLKVPIDELEVADEMTRPGQDGWHLRRTERDDPSDLPPDEPVAPSRLIKHRVQICPRCRRPLSQEDADCAACGYSWPAGHPSARTQQLVVETVPVRHDPRYVVAVPVIYSSATLTVDAIVRDLSRGGMFIATDLLDPIDTPCELTALPDGQGAVQFSGVVAHVSDGSGPHPCGFGVRLLGGSPDAMRWLEMMLARFDEMIVAPRR
jgi:predicted component of type VI protein secretion system